MIVETIEDWRGEKINAARSRGGTLLICDPYDNLLRPPEAPWPPPALVMKLGRGDARHPFDGELLDSVSGSLGHYSVLQSINSEDAITWSFFGPLMLAAEEVRVEFLNWLMATLALPWTDNKRCTIDLWRRIPHPRKPQAPGPELDAVIDGDQAVAFVEAKWRSGEGRGQGPDGTATQTQLRAEFFEVWGAALYGERGQVVVGLTDGHPIGGDGDHKAAVHGLTWSQLADYGAHPNGSEFAEYLAWKRRHSARRVAAKRSSSGS